MFYTASSPERNESAGLKRYTVGDFLAGVEAEFCLLGEGWDTGTAGRTWVRSCICRRLRRGVAAVRYHHVLADPAAHKPAAVCRTAMIAKNSGVMTPSPNEATGLP
jgi:hypothetical protein